MNKNTLKLITEPIWKPIVLIGKGIKELYEEMLDGFMGNLKNEDGFYIWMGFTTYAAVSFVVISLILGMYASISIALITSFVILFPIYLAIYYARSYFKRKDNK